MVGKRGLQHVMYVSQVLLVRHTNLVIAPHSPHNDPLAGPRQSGRLVGIHRAGHLPPVTDQVKA